MTRSVRLGDQTIVLGRRRATQPPRWRSSDTSLIGSSSARHQGCAGAGRMTIEVVVTMVAAER
jgi:hypothetical protein